MPRITFAVLAMLCAASVAPASASTPDPSDPRDAAELDVWADPSFRRQVVGDFGVKSDVEPTLDAVERERFLPIADLLEQGHDDEAIAELESIVAPAPAEDESKKKKKRRRDEAELPERVNPIFRFTLGQLYLRDDRFEDAIAQYRAAIDDFPSYLRAWKSLGIAQVRTGDNAGAAQAFSKVIELGGGDGSTYGLLGYAYSALDQYLSAESAYRNAILLDPETLDWRMGLTKAVFKQRKYGETVALAEELITRFPDRVEFWLLQANAYIGLNQPLEAAKNFEMLSRMGKATPASLNTLGDIYVNQELWDLAARAYGAAVERFPDQNPATALRAVEVLAQRGAREQAETLLATVRSAYGDSLDDEQRRRLLKLEARMAVNAGESGEVVDVLEEIVALDPLDGEALMLLGQHYAGAADPERAIFYYERAQNIDGFAAQAMLRHAQLLVDQSRYRDAVPLLKQAQDLEPRDDVARFLEQVERIARSTR